ncbi:hypothetical protein [Paralcaligenes ginsengisoli]
MSKHIKKKHDRPPSPTGKPMLCLGIGITEGADRYVQKPLTEIDFDLEKQAVRQILDSVLRLQTYIALRERQK